mmetsp:Transcript_15722/g.26504  ORF Transcript_15722/g.26504 Transcript_15722/m.26504 type:complete len:88 (-) Transcript_15722:37-300(-)
MGQATPTTTVSHSNTSSSSSSSNIIPETTSHNSYGSAGSSYSKKVIHHNPKPTYDLRGTINQGERSIGVQDLGLVAINDQVYHALLI